MTRRRRRPTPTRALLAALALLLLPALVRAQTTVVEYYHLDALGTVRAVTDQAGAVVERHDYLPYGEEWCGTAVCSSPTQGQPLRFTGKERDAETGLDYFGARYYGSKIGRFTTTDPVYDWKEDIAEPQRWNRYAYARNNPLRYVDPDGRRDGKTGLDMRQVQANADAIGKVLVNTVRAINSPGHMSAEKARAYYEQPDSPDQALRMDVADLLLTAWLGATLVKKGPEGPYDYIPDGPSVGPGKPFTPDIQIPHSPQWF